MPITKKITARVAAFALAIASAWSTQAQVIDITETNLTGTINWTANNVYRLTGQHHVLSNSVLNIEAGTVILGATNKASALIICRGAKIFAEGTASRPIIMTSESDLSWATGLPDSEIIYPTDKRWGGLIVYGNALLNSTDTVVAETPIVDVMEGLDDGLSRAGISGFPQQHVNRFGGSDDADSSGILRYVSIRHGGTQLGPNQEINGLTLGAVGSGTVIEYIEIYDNFDDGVEFFGGSVNTRYITVAFAGDDGFDTDQGYHGKNQFWFQFQGSGNADGNDGGEHDGDLAQGVQGETPISNFKVWNATYIGNGVSTVMHIRDESAASYYNSVFTKFNKGIQYANDGVLYSSAGTNQQSFIQNNIISVSGPVDVNPANAPGLLDATNKNLTVDPQLLKVPAGANDSFDINGMGLDPRPAVGSPALDVSNVKSTPAGDDFICQTDYLGAFATNDLWIARWTALAQNWFVIPNGGVLSNNVVSVPTNITGVVHWYRTNTYNLTARTYVLSGAELHIEPGTVVKGNPGTDGASSALFVTRGAKIFARGTRHNPIIMTSVKDEFTSPLSANYGTLVYPDTDRWGGLLVYGYAPINTTDTAVNPPEAAVVDVMEGLDDDAVVIGPDTYYIHRFGGNDTHDNSGVIQYVSIRHGGTQLAPNQEINGLTLGGVGDGTTIDHVEIFDNQDDGVEFFGGSVNTKYITVALAGDDGYDTDQGYNGKNQFWLLYQGDANVNGNDGGEHDGDLAQGAQGELPISDFKVWNATYFGNGKTVVAHIRDESAGSYRNSIFTKFDLGIQYANDGVAYSAAGTNQMSFIQNNLINVTNAVNVNPANSPDILDPANQNSTDDPLLVGAFLGNNLQTASLFDPRLQPGSPAYSNVRPFGNNDVFFTPVAYRGAFGVHNWTADWTAIDMLKVQSGRGGAAPDITAQPVGSTAKAGDDVTLSVGIKGSALSYQWYGPAGLIAGATNATLTLTGISPSDLGLYRVEISNAGGSLASVTVPVAFSSIATYAGVTIEGVIGTSYQIQYTTSLNDPITWTDLEVVTTEQSPQTFIDTTKTTQSGSRFYRAVPLN